MHRFVLQEQSRADRDLRRLWRETTQSPCITWDLPVHDLVYRTLRATNQGLPPERRVRLLLSVPPIGWAKLGTAVAYWDILSRRDTTVAVRVEPAVLRHNNKTTMMIAGMGHSAVTWS